MKFSGYGYEMEELREKFEGEGIKVDAELKIQNRKVSGLATPEDTADAVTLGYANNNYMNKSTDNIISGNNTFTGENTFTGDTIFSNTITGDISGNAGTVTDGVYTTGDQTIGGNKTFSNTITGDISGNAGTVTNGVYTTGNQTIGGNKTFSNTITGDISGNAGTVTNGVYTTGNQTIGGNKTFSNTITGDISGNAGTVTNGVYTTGNQTIAGIKTFSDSIAVDTVSEGAGADGVTVDGVKLKDGAGNFTGGVYSEIDKFCIGMYNVIGTGSLSHNAIHRNGAWKFPAGVNELSSTYNQGGGIHNFYSNKTVGVDDFGVPIFTINPSGVVIMPNQIASKASLNTAQSIPNGVVTTLICNQKSYDNQSNYNTSTGVFTVPMPGRYSVKASVSFSPNNRGIRQLIIYVNGILFSGTSMNALSDVVYGMFLSASDTFKLNIGDTITIRCLQTSGGNLNVIEIYTSFAVDFLG